MKCELCGHTFDRLFKSLECNLDLCPDCYEGVEGERPEMRTPKEMPAVEGVTIRMDARMLRTLEKQSEIQGFMHVEAYIHAVLFPEAVKAYLEDIADPETVEEEAAYVRELKDWLIYR